MTHTLKKPDEYLDELTKLRKINPYANNWTLHLERHTNKHYDSYGRLWGWYEVHPLGITVGYWEAYRDDLLDVDIDSWNKEAQRISEV